MNHNEKTTNHGGPTSKRNGADGAPKNGQMELKPCPFCGKFDSVALWEQAPGFLHYVCCTGQKGGCGARTTLCEKKITAVVTWNSRAPLPDNKALTVEELREMSGKSAWFDAGEPFGIKPCIIKRVEGWQLKEQAYDPKHPMMTWFWMFNTEGEMRSFDAEYAMMIGRKFYRRPPDKGA